MKTHDESVATALAELERTLLTPLIPGEVETWAQAAWRAFAVAAPLLQQRIRCVHAEEISQILDDDPELSAQVQRLRETGNQILAAMENLGLKLSRLARITPALEPNEAPAAEIAKRLSQQGIELVVSIRRQDEEIRTWQSESVLRDRGPVD